jgi:hypothetical protein
VEGTFKNCQKQFAQLCNLNVNSRSISNEGYIYPIICALLLDKKVTTYHCLMSSTVQQDATIYSLLYFFKLLYMFRVVTPPIIRSTYNCNYSIWHWSNRFCYLPLWWRSWNCSSSSNFSTSDGRTSPRCCDYSYICSWWWVELPSETCRAVYKNIINCI